MDHHSLIICRCEEVTLGQLEQTAKRYQCSARELKLRTRAGMGYCGGRTCRHFINQIVMQNVPGTIEGEAPLKYQPPVRPVSFGNLSVSFGGERT